MLLFLSHRAYAKAPSLQAIVIPVAGDLVTSITNQSDMYLYNFPPINPLLFVFLSSQRKGISPPIHFVFLFEIYHEV